MSKYSITRSCGHTETVQIAGPYAGRDRQAQYESTRLCAACYAAEQAQLRAAASAAAAEAAKASGLPALVGTEKQVAWAETIRQKVASDLAPLRALMQGLPADKAAIAKTALSIIDSTLACTSAHEWIESRDRIHDRAWLAQRTQSAMHETA